LKSHIDFGADFISFEHVNTIMSCRETSFSSLSKRTSLQNMVKCSLRDARRFEARALLASSCMSRSHNALQNALTTATYLNQIVKPCQHAGVDIDGAARFESANVLWDQNEMTASIRMLQDLDGTSTTGSDIMRPGKAELLAKLVSCSRLFYPPKHLQ
jgi:ataxia telangiectasia mutated family protein